MFRPAVGISLFKEHVEQIEESTAIEVQTTTIDTYCEEHNVIPTFIKIDTEGAEWKVLRGAQHILEQHKPDMLVEINSAPLLKEKIWNFLSELKYHCYFVPYIVPKKFGQLFNPINSLVEFLEAGGPSGNANFIFLDNPLKMPSKKL